MTNYGNDGFSSAMEESESTVTEGFSDEDEEREYQINTFVQKIKKRRNYVKKLKVFDFFMKEIMIYKNFLLFCSSLEENLKVMNKDQIFESNLKKKMVRMCKCDAPITGMLIHDHHLYLGDSDGKLYVWDLQGIYEEEESNLIRGVKEVGRLDLEMPQINDLCVHNRYLIATSKQVYRILSLDNLMLGKNLQETSLDKRDNKVVALVSDSDYLYMSLREGTIEVLKFSEDPHSEELTQRITKFKGHYSYTDCILIIDDLLVTGSYDYNIKIWDRSRITDSNQRLIKTLKGHNNLVDYLDFNDNFLFSASNDNTIKVWDRHRLSKKDKQEAMITFKQNKIHLVSTLQVDGRYLYSGDERGKLNVWQIEPKDHRGMKPINKIKSNQIAEVVFVNMDQEKNLYCIDNKNNSFLWDMDRGYSKCRYEEREIEVFALDVNCSFITHSDLLVFIGKNSGEICVYIKQDLKNKKLTEKKYLILRFHTCKVAFLTLDNDYLYSGSKDKDIVIWDYKTIVDEIQAFELKQDRNRTNNSKIYEGKFMKIDAHDATITCLLNDKKFIYSSSLDGTIKLWPKSKIVLTDSLEMMSKSNYLINSRKFNPGSLKGSKIVPIDASSNLMESMNKEDSNLKKGSKLFENEGIYPVKSLLHQNEVDYFVIEENFVYSLTDRTVFIWDLKKPGEEDREPIKYLTYGNIEIFTSLELEKERDLLFACGSNDIVAWDLSRNAKEDDKPITKFRAHTKEICSLFLKEGVLVSSSRDRSVKFWDYRKKQKDLFNFVKKDHILVNCCKQLTFYQSQSDYTRIGTGMINYLKKFYTINTIHCYTLLEFFCTLGNEKVINHYLNTFGLSVRYPQMKNVLDILKKFDEEGGKNLIQVLARNLLKFANFNNKTNLNMEKDKIKKRFKFSFFTIIKWLSVNDDTSLDLTMSSQVVFDIMRYEEGENTFILDFVHKYLKVFIGVEREGQISDPHKNICKIPQTEKMLFRVRKELLKENPNSISHLEFLNTGFKISIANGLWHTKLLFKTIKAMNNEKRLDLKPLIDLKFRQIKKFLFIQWLLYTSFALFYNYYVFTDDKFPWMFITTFVLNIIFGLYELLCIKAQGLKSYSQNNSNLADIPLLTATMIFLFWNRSNSDSYVLSWANIITTFFVNLRAVLYLRFSDGFRNIIQLVFQIYIKIGYFVGLMIIYAFIYVSVLTGKDQIDRSRGLEIPFEDFSTKFQIAVKMNFGEFDFPDFGKNGKKDDVIAWLLLLPNAITIVIMLLNLIIAIVSKVFEDFQDDESIIDIDIKLSLIDEIETFLSNMRYKKRNVDSDEEYFHYYQYVQEKRENKDFDVLGKNLEARIDGIHQYVEEDMNNLKEEFESLQLKVSRLDDKFDSMDDKIDRVLRELNKR